MNNEWIGILRLLANHTGGLPQTCHHNYLAHKKEMKVSLEEIDMHKLHREVTRQENYYYRKVLVRIAMIKQV